MTRQALLLVLFTLPLAAQADRNISGTWKFRVELESGGIGEPTFVLKQTGKQVAGSYKGPVGEHKVSGTVDGNRVTLTFDFEQQDTPIKATCEGNLDSDTAMTGKVTFTPGGAGKWTAQKSK